MSEESIIKKVASAIWKQRVETAAKNGVDLSKDDEEFMISANSIVDEARAAIQAYEAAKMHDLMAGMLSHNITMDGDKMLVNYVERDKMLNGTTMDDLLRQAVNRLAERKP